MIGWRNTVPPRILRIVPFGDRQALTDALLESLRLEWPVAPLTQYALQNHWDTRIDIILEEYNRLCSGERA